MTQPRKRSVPLPPLLIAIALDAVTFACFYGFYTASTGNTLWLLAGLACAVASFPFYTKFAAGLQWSKR
jgi:hypothetical protein